MNTLKKFFSHRAVLLALFGAVLVGVTILSLSLGSTYIPLGKVFGALFGNEPDSSSSRIVLYVRLPRTLAGLIAGAGLAVSGVLLQAVLQNPLASGGIVGINAGSGVMAMVAAVALPSAYIFMPLFAFLGAVLASLFVYFLAVKTGAGKTTIILSGVAVSSFLTAIIDALITVFPSAGVDRLAFLIGGFSGVTLSNTAVAGIFVALGFLLSMLLSYDLNVLGLGGEVARSLGMKVKRMQLVYLVLASLLAGAAISLAGLIGFVGLIVPHFVRMLVGGDHRFLVPLSGLAGGAFTVVCDLIARSAFSPYELPVGILLSLLGAPFFIFLLFQKRGGRRRRVRIK